MDGGTFQFREGTVKDVIVRPLNRYTDHRGWLMELFRQDELDEAYHPVMAYVSMTYPGVTRGPHEHREQTDLFAFVGPSRFKVYLWDMREGSPTFGVRQVITAGEDAPMVILVPPGVVHAYRNVGNLPGLVFNAPNRLYRGWGRKEPVDEIRHEDRSDNLFQID
jgi:dTDP-4-dehydrorhamnose 3,5-epimerase